MSEVSLKFKGGGKLAERLSAMAADLKKAHAVRVGFLEGTMYPASDGGARLADAAKRVTPEIAADHPDWKPRLEAWSKWQASHTRTLSVAQVAFWNEFGTTTSKPRPFFRNTITKHSGEWGERLGKYLKSSEFDAGLALAKLGLLVQTQIEASIREWPADNAPLTVHIKGFDHGLVDHSTMLNSVRYEVRS